MLRRAALVEEVAKRAALSRADAERAVHATFGVIAEVLAAGASVSVAGFGRFHSSERGARAGVNPRSGEPIQIPAVRVARLAPAAALKAAVRAAPTDG